MEFVKCAADTTNKTTCYTDESLLYIKSQWNKRHPTNKIESDDAREIWNSLRKNLASACNNEECWLRQTFMEGKLTPELQSYTFAPKMPKSWKKNPTEWLSNVDILNVMKQYENKYWCFNFIGPSPIDFDKIDKDDVCVWPELCKFNLNDKIRENKCKIGIIFNTDPHNKSGEHWISLFIDIKKRYIYFFDSAGDKPPKEVQKFMDKVVEQGNQVDIPFKTEVNTIRHQKKNTECGVYSLYFIIEMIKNGDPFMFTHEIPDNEIQKFREEYFNAAD